MAGSVALLGGCIFSLADLVDSGQGGAGGVGPFGGGSGVGGTGAVATGGTEDTDVDPPCPADQKRCSTGECRPISVEFGCGSSACVACPTVAQGAVGCSETGECVLQACQPGFADCNGDVIDGLGDPDENGCEFRFPEVSPSPEVLPVPFREIRIDDNSAADWGAIPAYGYSALCQDCRDDVTAPITEDGTIPLRNDLEAYFRVAWNTDFLFVVQDAFDPSLLDDSTRFEDCNERGGDGAAVCEDGFQIFFDGRENVREGYFNDNIRLVVGVADRIFAPSQNQGLASSNTAVKTTKWAPACYRMEARFDWRYITNSLNGNQAPPGQFPPLAGQQYGFDIAVNDWDPSIADEALFERQSQVFWLSAGIDYARTTQGLPRMILEGGPDAGAP